MAAKVDKKEAILDAMLDMVVEGGFHNAPMSQLSKRSGASTGVIYHYFPSKEDLIHALYLRVKDIKRRVAREGYSTDMSVSEAYLHFWANSYRFYRTHSKETRFLDQYENSPFCGSETQEELLSGAYSEEDMRFLSAFRPLKQGGVLKDLPPEAIHELSFGLAMRLAKHSTPIEPEALSQIAELSWKAILAE